MLEYIDMSYKSSSLKDFSFYFPYSQINVREIFTCQGKIERIPHLHFDPEIVTVLDLNFCYWMSSKEIKSFATQCKNLKEFSVAHSNITIEDLTGVLECKKITKLSLSTENLTHCNFWLEDTSESIHPQKLENAAAFDEATFWGSLVYKSKLVRCLSSFSRLLSLEIHTKQDPIILGTIIR